MAALYPPGPERVPADLTKPSRAYRRHAWLAMLGLLVFVAAYLGLLSWFAMTAWRLFRAVVSGNPQNLVMTLIAGFCAAFLAVFMAKALVFMKRGQSKPELQLKPEEQPELFAFLHRLADQAGAPRPHQVYLSAQVNACVFYDLTLANLIFPSRKNLEIGMALVNVLNLGEFKAVLAHEFGHFAQRTMAVGRWVYTAQQIAQHIIAKRDALDLFLQGLSKVDLRVAWIGWLLSIIVWSIRSLVELLFRVVILSERALSREMEYQADLVAVSLTGSDALIHALHKLSAADDAWDRALAFASKELDKGRPVADLFALQEHILMHLRRIFDEPDYGQAPDLPETGRESHRVFKTEIVQPPQMWSTHPASSDREHNAKRIYVAASIDDRPAHVLIRDFPALRLSVSLRLLSKVPEAFAELSDSLQRLDQEFAHRSLDRRYRGNFLGRAFTREWNAPSDLIVPFASGDMAAEFASLYPETHSNLLENLRELQAQHHVLDATRRGVLRAGAGVVRWRGEELRLHQLPAVIAQLDSEIGALREQVRAHDQRCRSVHIAAAKRLGKGWEALLLGQLGLVHYCEHTSADLRDLQRVVSHVLAIITADGKVSAEELARLTQAGNDLRRVLAQIYEAAPEIKLDTDVIAQLERVRKESAAENSELKAIAPEDLWQAKLGSFDLPPATAENINQWLNVIDGWVNSAASALGILRNAALESLLANEARVEQMLIGGDLHLAPAPSSVPANYPTLRTGAERPLKDKLTWWDRFQTADGLFATGARLAVAGSVVGGVVVAGAAIGMAKVSIYNGLDQVMQVQIDDSTLNVPVHSFVELDVPADSPHTVHTQTLTGEKVESFDVHSESGATQFVYNIAQSAALIEWYAFYGQAGNAAPRTLGAPRWSASYADHVLTEPPEQISTQGAGEMRTVLSAISDSQPANILGNLGQSRDAAATILAHARWDSTVSPYLMEWLWLANKRTDLGREVLATRLRRNPEEVISLRTEQDHTEGAERQAVCDRHQALANRKPTAAALQYVAIRCQPDSAAQDEAFLAAQQRWPEDSWLALAAGYVHASRQNWQHAQTVWEQTLLRPSEHFRAPSYLLTEMARVERLLAATDTPRMQILTQRSPYLQQMRALESGNGIDDAYIAYSQLAAGKVEAALRSAQSDAALRPSILILAAASDNAPAELASQALGLPIEQVDASLAWYLWALAKRGGVDGAALQAHAFTEDEENPAMAEAMAMAIDGAPAAQVEAKLGTVTPRNRGLTYATLAVALGDRCPSSWRQAAKRLLFASERPYLR